MADKTAVSLEHSKVVHSVLD